MNTSILLNELAQNEREVSHDRYGTFIICRPNNRAQADIESARTRSINKDLQQKEVVNDPITGENKLVPAFLTKNKKMELLKEHGEWSDDYTEETRKAEIAYRDACMGLEQAGFEGTKALVDEYKQIYQMINEKLGEEAKKYSKDIQALIPLKESFDNNSSDLPLPTGSYSRSRIKLEKAIKDPKFFKLFDRIDELYKQYNLLREGIESQANLYTVKLREVMLFSDTVEARADKATQIAKIYNCTLDPETRERIWKSSQECQETDKDLLAWLLSKIESFERLEDGQSFEESEELFNKFNFLFPLGSINDESESSPAQRSVKQDGESQTETQSDSSED